MDPLRCREVRKSPGFNREMVPIRDGCYLFVDSQFVDIVFEHDNSLECHGFSRNAISSFSLKTILEQPVLNTVDESLVDIMKDTVKAQTIDVSSNCSELRSKCRSWFGNHYISKLYNGHYSSVYSFVYRVGLSNTMVCLQAVNYGKQNMRGSFVVDRDIIDKVYNIVKEGKGK